MNCAHCGAWILWAKQAGGWLHAEPLGLFRLSHAEYRDIVTDPPLKGLPLHRQTYIHPAQPAGARGPVRPSLPSFPVGG